MIYKTSDASKYLGVSINTIKTLSNRLKLKSFRTSGGHRRFRQEDLDLFIGKITEVPEKLTVIYARCSTAKQKENLERQKERLRKHAESKSYKYIIIDESTHHLDENKQNNLLGNLMLFSSESAHQRFHHNPDNVNRNEIIFDGRQQQTGIMRYCV